MLFVFLTRPAQQGSYLEGNSWLCQVNGLNLLVDPVFGVLDFGVPALIQARKKVRRTKKKKGEKKRRVVQYVGVHTALPGTIVNRTKCCWLKKGNYIPGRFLCVP